MDKSNIISGTAGAAVATLIAVAVASLPASENPTYIKGENGKTRVERVVCEPISYDLDKNQATVFANGIQNYIDDKVSKGTDPNSPDLQRLERYKTRFIEDVNHVVDAPLPADEIIK